MVDQGTSREILLLSLYTHFPLLMSLFFLPPAFTAFLTWRLAASNCPEGECNFHTITLRNTTSAVISDFHFRKPSFKNSYDNEERNQGVVESVWSSINK